MDRDFSYAKSFASLDLAAVKRDLATLMTDSKDWWPADWGHTARCSSSMAWHSAGTYRTSDGRGGAARGTQRFAPLNSWPTTSNSTRRADCLADQAEVRQPSVVGRPDDPRRQRRTRDDGLPDLRLRRRARGRLGTGEDIDWGSEDSWLGDRRYSGERSSKNPLAAVQMGLIYVNPEGATQARARRLGRDIRETFARMAMNDEETVALVAGGHTFGKAHGAATRRTSASKPEGARSRPWASAGQQPRSGKGGDTITSGIEGAWTPNPTRWDNGYFDMLFGYDWELTRARGRAPVDG